MVTVQGMAMCPTALVGLELFWKQRQASRSFSAIFQVVGFRGQAAGHMKKQTKTHDFPYELTAR